ncbi:MAG TPA: hypothetical protein V6C50_05260 [Crinalium sp.]
MSVLTVSRTLVVKSGAGKLFSTSGTVGRPPNVQRTLKMSA